MSLFFPSFLGNQKQNRIDFSTGEFYYWNDFREHTKLFDGGGSNINRFRSKTGDKILQTEGGNATEFVNDRLYSIPSHYRQTQSAEGSVGSWSFHFVGALSAFGSSNGFTMGVGREGRDDEVVGPSLFCMGNGIRMRYYDGLTTVSSATQTNPLRGTNTHRLCALSGYVDTSRDVEFLWDDGVDAQGSYSSIMTGVIADSSGAMTEYGFRREGGTWYWRDFVILKNPSKNDFTLMHNHLVLKTRDLGTIYNPPT